MAILLRVVKRNGYHRGVVADMLSPIPKAPPTTVLPVFLRSYAP